MTTIHDCALNGALLSGIDEAICVLDVREDAPRMHTAALALPGGGRQVLAQSRESLSIQVLFAVHEPDPVRRHEILRDVAVWAMQGGYFTISARPGQQLQCSCTALPAASAEDWTEALQLTFTSLRTPYWQDAVPTLCLAEGETRLSIPGTAEATPVNVQLHNDGEAPLTRLSLRCNASAMVFEGLSLPAGGTFRLRHEDGLLSATAEGESVLHARTPESPDALLAPCGDAALLHAEADQPVTVMYTVRGRYL